MPADGSLEDADLHEDMTALRTQAACILVVGCRQMPHQIHHKVLQSAQITND